MLTLVIPCSPYPLPPLIALPHSPLYSVTYKSFTMSIVRVVDTIYVIKALNIEDNGEEGEMEQPQE